MGVRVAAFYRFARFDDPTALKAPLTTLCCARGVKGTVLLAQEGINGTIAGPDEGIAAVLAHVRTLPGCAGIEVKESRAETMPFYRVKVRVKREIVTMGEPDIDPLDTGNYVSPADWNGLIADPDTILIDTRNDYEVAIGTFEGAIDPETPSFRDFPAWFRDKRETLLKPDVKVAMFCTGGIRCEKATAFLKSEGVEDVFHLRGGILAYLEQVPAKDSKWRGECFVFDQRVAVGHGLEPGSHGLCYGCRRPVGPEDRASPLYIEGVSCASCHLERGEEQRAGYAERHRQTRIAEARGQGHVGVRPTEPSSV